MWTGVSRTGNALLSLLYPMTCAMCGVTTDAAQHLCSPCGKRARRIESPFCQSCSQPFSGAIESEFTCANCGDRKLHFSHAVAPYRSDGVVREFVHRFKYDGAFYLRHQLAAWLAETLADPRMKAHPVDALIPVPLHPTRKREREFNQAEVLAGIVAKTGRLRVVPMLKRVRYTTTQTRLDRHERMENLRNAFALAKTADVPGKHLVLVDDVLTTGSTLDECARVLRAAGAASVRAITVARG